MICSYELGRIALHAIELYNHAVDIINTTEAEKEIKRSINKELEKPTQQVSLINPHVFPVDLMFGL